jgi:hypothetical protein
MLSQTLQRWRSQPKEFRPIFHDYSARRLQDAIPWDQPGDSIKQVEGSETQTVKYPVIYPRGDHRIFAFLSTLVTDTLQLAIPESVMNEPTQFAQQVASKLGAIEDALISIGQSILELHNAYMIQRDGGYPDKLFPIRPLLEELREQEAQVTARERMDEESPEEDVQEDASDSPTPQHPVAKPAFPSRPQPVVAAPRPAPKPAPRPAPRPAPKPQRRWSNNIIPVRNQRPSQARGHPRGVRGKRSSNASEEDGNIITEMMELLLERPLTTARVVQCDQGIKPFQAITTFVFSNCSVELIAMIPKIDEEIKLSRLQIHAHEFPKESNWVKINLNRVIPEGSQVYDTHISDDESMYFHSPRELDCLPEIEDDSCKLCMTDQTLTPIVAENQPCLYQILNRELATGTCPLVDVEPPQTSVQMEDNRLDIISSMPGLMEEKCPHQPKAVFALKPAVTMDTSPQCRYTLRTEDAAAVPPNYPGTNLRIVPMAPRKEIQTPKQPEREIIKEVHTHFHEYGFIYTIVLAPTTAIILIVLIVLGFKALNQRYVQRRQQTFHARHHPEEAEEPMVVSLNLPAITLQTNPGAWRRTTNGIEIG